MALIINLINFNHRTLLTNGTTLIIKSNYKNNLVKILFLLLNYTQTFKKQNTVLKDVESILLK